MSHIFFQLGSQADISEEELYSTFQTETEIFSGFAFGEMPTQKVRKKFDELGGIMRAGVALGEEKSFEGVQAGIIEHIEKNAKKGKKMKVGIFIGSNQGWKKFGIGLQKAIKLASKGDEYSEESAFSVRIVNRDAKNLDSYAVHKEKLLEKGNAEYVCIPLPTGWAWGISIGVQKAFDFAARDMKKPVRDMKVGLMPPKLARIMINMTRDESGNLPAKIYDPFCGMGTVLLEGMSLGLKVAGSDLSKRMVEATKKNTKWYFDYEERNKPKEDNRFKQLGKENKDAKFNEFDVDEDFISSRKEKSKNKDEQDDKRDPFFLRDIFMKDATKSFYPDQKKKINKSAVVGEGFLGKIFHKPVNLEQYESQKSELFPMYRQFLFQLSSESISKIVFAFPFWVAEDKAQKTFSFVPELITFAENLGLKLVKSPIRYVREGQVVGREIVTFEKR